MARRKVAAEPVLKSWAEVDEALAEVRTLSVEQATAQATLDAALAEVQAKHQDSIQARAARIARLEKDLEEYTTAHKNELETTEGRRSKRLPNGTVGFRRSTAVGTRSKWTWAKVTEAIQGAGKRFAAFLRIKHEPDKEALGKALADGTLTEAGAKRIGVELKQKDTFGYDPNADDTAATVPIDGAKAKAAG